MKGRLFNLEDLMMNKDLCEIVKYYEQLGCTNMSNSLGIQIMPAGYALMLNADMSHYFWCNYRGEESVISVDRWAAYRGACNDSAKLIKELYG